MNRKTFIAVLSAASFLFLGAACSSTTTVKVNNVNTSITTQTNTTVGTNSGTTGSFDTSGTVNARP